MNLVLTVHTTRYNVTTKLKEFYSKQDCELVWQPELHVLSRWSTGPTTQRTVHCPYIATKSNKTKAVVPSLNGGLNLRLVRLPYPPDALSLALYVCAFFRFHRIVCINSIINYLGTVGCVVSLAFVCIHYHY